MTMLSIPLRARNLAPSEPMSMPSAFLLWFTTSLGLWIGLALIVF